MMRLATALVMAMLLVPGLQAQEAERLFKAALNTEQVQGDLRAAIRQYEQVVARAGSDRALAAQALVRIAECHQKMGDAEARSVYSRIVREYADQPDAVVLARARMGGLPAGPSTTATGDRAVWTGPLVDLFGQVSPDGRLLTYVDWNTGCVMVHDLVTNADRNLTPQKPYERGNGGWSSISKDGRRAAYVWSTSGPEVTHAVYLTDLSGSDPRALKPLFVARDPRVRGLAPFDWSPDGQWIALGILYEGFTSQIALLSVADGSTRVLKSLGWRGPGRMFFSPDGRSLAYDMPDAPDSQSLDVFVMAVDGSGDVPAVRRSGEDRPVGWSPDGSAVLFSSDRAGSFGIWAQPMAGGRPRGAPELLRADIGESAFSLGLTASGTLMVYKATASRDVNTVPIDLAAGKLSGPPVGFAQGYLQGPGVPDWSPDGRSLAYQACGGQCIAIRAVDTGVVRRVPTPLLFQPNPRWSPDGRQIVTASRDRKGRNGIFLVDVETGAATPVLYGPNFGSNPHWSPDGASLYYLTNDPRTLMRRDLAAGTDHVVLKHAGLYADLTVSPDGRFVTVKTGAGSTAAQRLLLVPIAGGEPRELLSAPNDDVWNHNVAWTPDSRNVLVGRKNGARSELLLVPIDGSAPRTLDIDVQNWRSATAPNAQGFSLSRDGRHIAFLTGKDEREVWAIENLLPRRTSKR